ncbi:MAG: porin [Proteobacteria bacterium]|nr:porin [Pseudomonadota bacterium]
MTKQHKPGLPRLRPLLASLSLALVAGGAMAAEPIPAGVTVPEVEPTAVASGALAAAKLNPNNLEVMKKLGLTFGGWLQTGVTYNSTNPGNGFNGPVTFGDRSAELQLNQLYFYLQRPVATEGDSWDFGGRVDFMYGSDSIFTQAYGVPAYDVNNGAAMQRSHWDLNLLRNTGRFYDIALPQVYLEAYIPIGNGLNLKAGHFYTPIGYEVVTAPDNFFYSHSYTMQYGEPFTHTGLLANYAFDKNWSTIAGLLTGSATGGWDGGWDQQLGNWTGLLGGTWNTEDKATSMNITGTYGGTSERSSQSWGMYSMVFKHNLMDDLHMVVQHDHGYANGVLVSSGVRDAEWYGINSYLMYDITDKLGAGIRAEWFRDNAGFRVCSPGRVAAATNDSYGSAVSSASSVLCGNGSGFGTPASYYAITAGVNYKPLKWLTLRPNVRYDWADGSDPVTGNAYKPFGNGKDAQFLFSADAVIVF